MWKISKDFEFDYGHRVWTQELQTEYSIDNECKCKAYHGHRGKIVVHLSAAELNKQGMVTDFKHLNWFKQFIDTALDHKFIIDIHDPIIDTELYWITLTSEADFVPPLNVGPYSVINPSLYAGLGTSLREKYAGMIFVNFVPTSENLAKWIYDIVNDKMKDLGVIVDSIEFWETPKSCSTYSLPQ